MPCTHRERLEKTLTGTKPDRPPIALWHHFPVDDQNPTTLAKATIAFQDQFDFDLIKVMPASSSFVKDWGGVTYDIPLLEAVSDLWANLAHIHGESIMFDLIAEYPVQILNWHDRETSPSLADGLQYFQGTVCCGIIRHENFVLSTPETIREDIINSVEQTGGKRLLSGTGCVLLLTTPYGNIWSAQKAVEVIK